MKRMLLAFSLLCSFQLIADDAISIRPFVTDGCSTFPDGTLADRQRWQDCCIAHDLAYWAGGTREDRKAVDEAFAQCIAEHSDIRLSEAMRIGVRFGGSPIFPTSYRWGYGWPFWRGYAPLTEQEKQQIIDAIDRMPPDALEVRNEWQLLDFSGWKKPQIK